MKSILTFLALSNTSPFLLTIKKYEFLQFNNSLIIVIIIIIVVIDQSF